MPTKPTVAYDESFAKLDIRVGRVVEVELETRTHKPNYKMVVDFEKYGKHVSYGRFTQHPIDEVKNRLVLGVLNFETRQMGPVTSEVLILGVQYPKAKVERRPLCRLPSMQRSVASFFDLCREVAIHISID